MNFLSGLADTLTGGLASSVYQAVKDYFPPDMTPEQKAAIEIELQKIELEKAKSVNDAISSAERSLNDRISMHEGTAKDLMALPFIGRVVIFARGCQRPMWGFATMYCDFQWLSGAWSNLSEQQEATLWVINLLVLGFLFGERAVQNVTPIVARYFVKK